MTIWARSYHLPFFMVSSFCSSSFGTSRVSPFYAHVAPTEAFTLVNRDFNGLLGFVFVGLDVGIQNAEIEIAVVLVELADALHVLREFLLVKLVALGQPSPHAAFAQRHLFHELAVGIDFVAFKFDVGNLGGFTLIDGDVDGNAVTREFGDGRRDLDRLFAAAFVFFLQAGDRRGSAWPD